MIPVGESVISVGSLDSLFVDKYVCSHCRWWGVAQVDRPSWSTLCCPRCGLETCSLIPDPVVTPIPINTLGDCPSGLQPEERSQDLFDKGIRGEVLYALADLDGGKGITIISDGGSMSGTYTGLVVCLGSATLTSNATINADLWVQTNLNGSTHNLEVKGNMYIGGTATFSDATNPTLTYTLTVNGNLHGNEVDANVLAVYGDVHLENLQTYSADVYGTLTVRNILNFAGRSQSYPDGGTVYADKMSIFTAEGSGYSVDSALNTLRSGSGGNLITTSDLTIGNIYISGGDRAGAVTVDASLDPANGGNLTIGGNAVITYLESNGGSINCSGTAEPQPPGNGGILEFSGSLKIGDINAIGGAQLTGVSPAGNGGQLSVSGHFYGDQILLSAGSASTTSPASGGDGGTGNFYGATFINIFTANGGSSLGTSAGGGGGSLYSYGTLQATTVNINGGSAQAGGINGSSGLFEIYKGCNVDTLTMTDGSGAGSQATNITQARLSGNCSFETVNMSARAVNPTNVRIYVWNNSGTLQITSMPNKTTLNISNAPFTATGSLSAYLQDSIFTATSSSNSTWYRHTGTAI